MNKETIKYYLDDVMMDMEDGRFVHAYNTIKFILENYEENNQSQQHSTKPSVSLQKDSNSGGLKTEEPTLTADTHSTKQELNKEILSDYNDLTNAEKLLIEDKYALSVKEVSK